MHFRRAVSQMMTRPVSRYHTALGLVVFRVAGAAPAMAKTGQVRGLVVDAARGLLPGSAGPKTVQKDPQGRFAFAAVSPGA